eukprot:scaffold30122_cov18-Tisochrysis_lutea.AAC.2
MTQRAKGHSLAVLQAGSSRMLLAAQQQWLSMLGRDGRDGRSVAVTAAAANEVSQTLLSMGARRVQVHTGSGAKASAMLPNMVQPSQQQQQQFLLAAGLTAVLLPDVGCILDSSLVASGVQSGRWGNQVRGKADRLPGLAKSSGSVAVDGVLQVGVLLVTEAAMLKGKRLKRRKPKSKLWGGKRAAKTRAAAAAAAQDPMRQRAHGHQQRQVELTCMHAPLQLTAEARFAQALLASLQGWQVVVVG